MCFTRYGSDPDDFEYAMSEFLRMNGMYWGVACMDLMGRLEVQASHQGPLMRAASGALIPG